MSRDRCMSLLRAYADAHGGAQEELALEQTLVVNGQRIGLCLVPDAVDACGARLLARVAVAHLPGVPAATISRMLQQANGCWSEMHGEVLGLHGSDVIKLSVSRRVDSLDAAGLAALLQSIALDAGRWNIRLAVALARAPC